MMNLTEKGKVVEMRKRGNKIEGKVRRLTLRLLVLTVSCSLLKVNLSFWSFMSSGLQTSDSPKGLVDLFSLSSRCSSASTRACFEIGVISCGVSLTGAERFKQFESIDDTFGGAGVVCDNIGGTTTGIGLGITTIDGLEFESCLWTVFSAPTTSSSSWTLGNLDSGGGGGGGAVFTSIIGIFCYD